MHEPEIIYTTSEKQEQKHKNYTRSFYIFTCIRPTLSMTFCRTYRVGKAIGDEKGKAGWWKGDGVVVEWRGLVRLSRQLASTPSTRESFFSTRVRFSGDFPTFLTVFLDFFQLILYIEVFFGETV